jgi:hypothetical protein
MNFKTHVEFSWTFNWNTIIMSNCERVLLRFVTRSSELKRKIKKNCQRRSAQQRQENQTVATEIMPIVPVMMT